MGAKASTVWYIDTPDPIAVLRSSTTSDWDTASALAGRLFPDRVAVPSQLSPVSAVAGVGPDEIYIGAYPGVTVVCSAELTVATPSTLPEPWIHPLAAERTYLVMTDPETAWGAFAYWERGTLRRSFSATPIYIYEDSGLPLVWERRFWAGEHPLVYPPGVLPDPLSLPFHPQEFAEAANSEWLGYRYTGAPRGDEFDPISLQVCGFTMHAPGQEPRRVEQAPPEAAPPEPMPDRSIMRWLKRKSPEPRS
ncbi:MAG: hypothetical protein ABIY38_02250 [Rhodococcus sp. (in: high G+C Gram-positive bacteria)]